MHHMQWVRRSALLPAPDAKVRLPGRSLRTVVVRDFQARQPNPR